MLKLIFLVGITKNMKKSWEGQTSKRERVFENEEQLESINGISFVSQKGKVIQRGTEESATFNFISLEDFVAEDIIKVSKRLKASPQEVVVIISRQNPNLLKQILPEKSSGRYHFSKLGWVVVLKGGVKFSEVSEIVAIFFGEDKNKILTRALKEYNRENFFSQNHKMCFFPR